MCSKKWHENDQKMRQKCQNLEHPQTSISQARNKLLTNFQRLESTTMDGHMVCVQKSDIERVKKWGKSAKIRGTFKLQYLKLETSFWQTFKGYNQLLYMDIWCVLKKSDIERVKKWGKSTKIWGNFKLQYIKLVTSFWQNFKG